jgi:hypothetical protein
MDDGQWRIITRADLIPLIDNCVPQSTVSFSISIAGNRPALG